MRDADVIFEWVVHPFSEQPKKALLFVGAMLLIGIAVWFSFQDIVWTTVALMILLGSLHRFWLPTRFRVSQSQIEVWRWFIRTVHPLENYKRAVIGDGWIFLSPFADPSRLDSHRGLLIQLASNAQGFKSFIESKVPKVVGA